MNDFTLIANSGIHFKTTETEISLDQPLMIQSGKTLKYTFLETKDLINFGQVKLDICSLASNQYATVKYLDANKLLEREPNGLIALDECGVPKVKQGTAMGVQQTCAPNDPRLMNINSLSSLRFNIKKTDKNGMVEMDSKTGFELLIGKWLPMPMYEYDENNVSTKYPNGWCRVRIDELGESDDGQSKRYRLTWAFDTQLAKDAQEGKLRPAFLAGNDEKKSYKICNRPDLLLGEFLNIPDGQNDAPIGTYLASLWGIDLSKNPDHKYKFLAYYIYLINYLRISGAAPDVILYHKTDNQIPVDMSIDIGNSRTCAVLFENGLFDKAKMLRIRDLSQPWKSYENAFDMRIVFRKADFGGDITMGKDLFQWKSLVRVGEEAKHLVYHSLEGNNESRRTTNHSSPKRYLWDDRLYDSRWELMVEEDDPTNVKVAPQIYTKGFTDYFDNDGTFLGSPKPIDLFHLGQKNEEQCHYSRQSLMTFVMIEIMQHAMVYINSTQFRESKHGYGQVDGFRYLRNIIVTCPTAMPLKEQYALRLAAKNASELLRKQNPSLPEITITPSPEIHLPQNNDDDEQQPRGWLYDEAFASQLVFLYAELVERYDGNVEHFFKLKGHERQETLDPTRRLNPQGLTIGTIDIGAGTTDVMITVYGQRGQGRLVPIPVYYDSFYSAGDDILRGIISDVVLEGEFYDNPLMGSVGNALASRILKMTPDELLTIPRVMEDYKDDVDDIRNSISEDEVRIKKNHLVHNLMNHFFGKDSAGMSEKDRRCRLDFCTQISLPISQFFLELLKKNRPSRIYTFNEIFTSDKPSPYLLKHFEYHFGFKFEDLIWRFDPEKIATKVKDALRSVIKALSQIVFSYHCDYLVLSGRPTSLKPVMELVLDNIPVPPSRLIDLNRYHVGTWFPLATQEGFFEEKQKAVVAVGAEVGYLASTVGYRGLFVDFSVMDKEMKSTAKFLGAFDDNLNIVRKPLLTPRIGYATLSGISVFPYYIGCKQFDSPSYIARPLYALYKNCDHAQLNVTLERRDQNEREIVEVSEVTDMEGNTLPLESVDLRLQTIASDGKFWMDKGAFTLEIQEK